MTICPSKYVVLNHDLLVDQVNQLSNSILNVFPEIDTGCHVSIPTVLEEDYAQRKVTIGLNAQSIDNEISQMAKAISLFNKASNTSISLSALHFATDYVRSPKDKTTETQFDLGNNQTIEAREAKANIINKICRTVLIPFFLEKN